MRDLNLLEHKNVRDFIEFMAKKNIEIKAETVSGDDWMEVDFEDEYWFAKNNFIKLIKEREMKGGNEKR
jgi:choline kinase